jgi:hypothetical protein
MRILTTILLAIIVHPTFAQKDNIDVSVGAQWLFDQAFYRQDGTTTGGLVFSEQKAFICYLGKLGFIDSNKTIVISPQFDFNSGINTNRFLKNRAAISLHRKWGVIDTLGNILLPFDYDQLIPYKDYYFIEQDYKWGYLNHDFEVVIPLNDRGMDRLRTNEEVEAYIVEWNRQDSIEHSFPIHKNEVIRKAKRAGYFSKRWKGTSITLNVESAEWTIQNTESKGSTHKGRCAHTNGCIILETSKMVIDATTGKVKQKNKSTSLMPIYE